MCQRRPGQEPRRGRPSPARFSGLPGQARPPRPLGKAAPSATSPDCNCFSFSFHVKKTRLSVNCAALPHFRLRETYYRETYLGRISRNIEDLSSGSFLYHCRQREPGRLGGVGVDRQGHQREGGLSRQSRLSETPSSSHQGPIPPEVSHFNHLERRRRALQRISI